MPWTYRRIYEIEFNRARDAGCPDPDSAARESAERIYWEMVDAAREQAKDEGLFTERSYDHD